MATKQMKKNELKFEDFEPVSELQELPEKYVLIVNLPGFRKEYFRVQVDSTGKLSVKGQKQFGDNKCKRFNKVIQLPSDSDIEKIRGKFEREVLSLTLPKREKALPSNQDVKNSTEEAEEAKPTDEEKASENKEEETKLKEEPEQTSLKKDEAVKPKEAETDKKVEDEPTTNGEKKEELAKAKEGTSMPGIKERAPSYQPIMKYKAEPTDEEKASEKKEEETKPKEEPEQTSLKKDEEVKPKSRGEQRENNDAINKWKQSTSSGENKEKTMKKNEKKNIVTWKEKISQGARGWSEYASLDSMRDTIKMNRKEIAIAVAAFSIGFLVYRKLSSRK